MQTISGIDVDHTKYGLPPFFTFTLNACSVDLAIAPTSTTYVSLYYQLPPFPRHITTGIVPSETPGSFTS
ncbi:hypothetical protein J6590_031041 [Homalodisca vitripennis]|nr:hypothetical protein J6590_031041 [Homalodisca vitripennis]